MWKKRRGRWSLRRGRSGDLLWTVLPVMPLSKYWYANTVAGRFNWSMTCSTLYSMCSNSWLRNIISELSNLDTYILFTREREPEKEDKLFLTTSSQRFAREYFGSYSWIYLVGNHWYVKLAVLPMLVRMLSQHDICSVQIDDPVEFI